MKRKSYILVLLSMFLLLFIGVMGNSSDCYAKGMTVTSVDRVNKKYVRVYFKPVKKAKTYKVEYYWKKSNGKISKAYYKLVESKDVKKSKKGKKYIQIPAKAPVQYASISYRTSIESGWKKWSGYKQAKCNHKYDLAKECVEYDDDGEGFIYYEKKCKICGYVDVIE